MIFSVLLVQLSSLVYCGIDVDDLVDGVISREGSSSLLISPSELIDLLDHDLLCRFEFQRTLLEHIFFNNGTIVVDLIVCPASWFNRTGLLQKLDDTEVLRLAKRLEEHKAVHLTILDLRRCHVLNCIRQGNATG